MLSSLAARIDPGGRELRSCCEKSPHALLELLALGLPVFVVDSRRWIGDDSFDRATSAPYWDACCGECELPDAKMGKRLEAFRDRLSEYDPRGFAEKFGYLDTTLSYVNIIKECHAS